MRSHLSATEAGVPRALEIALNGPVGPQRLRDDTVVHDVDGWYRTLTPSASFSAANEVLFSNLDPGDPDGHIERIVAEYHTRGLPMSWCVYPWTQPADLGARLLARGATRSTVRAFLASTSLPLQVVDGVDVRRVDPKIPGAVDAYVDLLSSGYGVPDDEAAFRRVRYRQLASGPAPVMHLFLARCGGEAAGCMAMVVKPDSAHLTGGTVLPAFQARGVFQSLIAAALGAMRDLEITLATGHSNEQSAFWVRRFGFELIYTYDIYELTPGGG